MEIASDLAVLKLAEEDRSIKVTVAGLSALRQCNLPGSETWTCLNEYGNTKPVSYPRSLVSGDA